MRVLSLFDGIATGRLALEMAGVPVDLYIASEIDKDAKAVARANWPDMIHIGPVENVTAPDLPKIDLVIGGSPCQGFSRAGAGLNFDDPRSRLFFDYVRVLNEVREKKPRREVPPRKCDYETRVGGRHHREAGRAARPHQQPRTLRSKPAEGLLEQHRRPQPTE